MFKNLLILLFSTFLLFSCVKKNIEEVISEPTDEEKVHRQLIIYRDVNGMGCGTNPGSHRLDGLSMKEAKNRHRRGQMSSSDYYVNMSENGLQAAANYYGSIYKEGNREETVRGLIEVIAKKQSLENHG